MRFQITVNSENGWHSLQLKDTVTGTIAEVIPDAGAILNSFSVLNNGRPMNLVEGFHSMADWNENKTKGFRSAKLSPYVCRVADSTYEWAGKTHNLSKFILNGVAIHGIIYDAAFQVVETMSAQDHAEVELKFAYRKGDPGFPFEYDCLVKYRLDADNLLTISTLIHNHDNVPIPMTDGWHPYFTFGSKVDGYQLMINTDKMLEYDSALIPTGNHIPVEGFRSGVTIGDRHFDNGFVLDQSAHQPMARLSDPASGMSLEFHPDAHYPFMQVYTPPHRNSIAIENLSSAPDAFNNGIGLVTLKPDESRVFTVKLKVTINGLVD
jgi:aldose 1-epimerase